MPVLAPLVALVVVGALVVTTVGAVSSDSVPAFASSGPPPTVHVTPTSAPAFHRNIRMFASS